MYQDMAPGRAIADGTASNRELRPYQSRAIAALRQSLAEGHRRPVLALPTGGGKTRIASQIIGFAREKSKRVVFCVPALSLIDQSVQSFWRDGVRDVGVIQANHEMTDWSRPVQVASVQTLARRGFPEADLVIIDECHRTFKTYNDWMGMAQWERVPFIGLSATPWTRGLGKIFDDLIIVSTTKAMIDDGYLTPFRVFAPAHPDLSGVRTVAGDYHEGELAKAMDKAPLVADIVETWIRSGEGRPTLCFGVDCAHAKHLQERFLGAGIPCGYQDAYTTSDERKAIKRDFEGGKLKVVCNIGTLTTGVDWDVRCIILARPTQSEMLFVQIIGRGLRTAVGKSDLLVLDHSDTHARLGFVTDIHHDKLNDGAKAAKEKSKPLPKECPKCTFLRPPRVAKCPCCGFTPEPPKSSVEHRDGSLVEISRGAKKGDGPKNHVRMGARWIPFADFYGELKTYGKDHGYKPGWPAAKFKDAIGVWPNAYRDAPEKPTSGEVDSWIRSRAIAWAKRQKPAEQPNA